MKKIVSHAHAGAARRNPGSRLRTSRRLRLVPDLHDALLRLGELALLHGRELLDLVFFTPEQLATMEEGEVNDSLARVVDIYNKVKAAAGA